MAAVQPYLQQTFVTYRIVLGENATVEEYGVKSLPATCVIDKKGRIAATYCGVVDESDIERNLRRVLRERIQARPEGGG